MNSKQIWQPELYDNKLGYVSHYGREVVELLNPASNESILDLGCGTGDLSFEIAKHGSKVTGVDSSEEMIEKARSKFRDIDFIVANCEEYQSESKYDAVFSNAALHWMNNQKVIDCVWANLNSGGRFVAELGGKGNIAHIIDAIIHVLDEYGIDARKRNPWYFPSIGEYSQLLEQQGFRVTYANHFDRPTKMEDGEQGLNHWIRGSAEDFFVGIDEQTVTVMIQKIAEQLRKYIFKNESWYVDYKRLRIVAVKP